MTTKSGFKLFAFGAAIGAVLGVLFAPESGDAMRKRLRKFSREEIPGDPAEKTEEMIQKTRNAIDEGLNKLSKIVDEKRSEFEQKVVGKGER